MTVGIVDYGCGNLFSLMSMFKKLGATAVATDDAKTLYKCDRIVLPGVGAFGAAAEMLKNRGLFGAVKELAADKPILGICLGMQLLFDKSYEYGEHDGLKLLRGEVRPIPSENGLKIPHIGWNSLDFTRDGKLLKNVENGEFVYFVHSFYACGCADSVTATAYYGAPLTAVVERDNVFGTQFHPEKSGETGLKIMQTFTEL